MATVYILYSTLCNQYYTGSCKELSERIDQDLSKALAGTFTSKADDWKLYFSIDELGYEQARKIEKHIKRMKSKKYIENFKKYPEIAQKLITIYK